MNALRDAHEKGLTSFLAAKQARRALALLKRKQGRAKLVGLLSHYLRLDPAYAHKLDSRQQTHDAIVTLLRRAGAGPVCYAISELAELDGKFLPLDEALLISLGTGAGTFLSCEPGRLGYYEAEDPGERYLLIRATKRITRFPGD
jgi:hypothetical protein